MPHEDPSQSTPGDQGPAIHRAAAHESGPRAPSHRRLPLHTKILIGLLIGATLGLAANAASSRVDLDKMFHIDDALGQAVRIAEFVGRIFLRLVLMVVLPLIISALALGVLELGDVRKLGRVGLRTLLLTLVLSATSVAIGITLVNAIAPGRSLPEGQRKFLQKKYSEDTQAAEQKAKNAKPLLKTLLDIIPENPLQEMVGGLDGSSPGNGMLAVMFFALILGIAISLTPERTGTLVNVLEGLFDVSMVIIDFAMRLAPYCVACLVFKVTAELGVDILKTLFWFVLTVLVGLGLQMFVVYPLLLVSVARRRPWQFFRDVSDATFTAFGTSSSNATLPTALRVAQEDLGLPREIARFVLTIGATGNQNGTALYEGVVVLFLAQVFGVELSIAQQITVVLMSVLAGVGTAGVPGGSIPLIIVVLTSVGVPADGIGIILGIDRILDMCRTTLNVTGDLVLATCVARQE
jgi:dicarboxylate/amino acid:cation (Na+ or H+) symporter, DAACS family